MQRASIRRQSGGNRFIVKDDIPEHDAENESEHTEEAPEKPTKIVVSNLPSSAHEDYMKLFFENTKKFGGGPVFNIEFDEEEGTAVIEFDEPEAVQRVLSKRPVIMMGQEIEVEIFVPEKPKPKCTIEVTGPPDVVSEEQHENLEMYFDNERRSGDGEIVGTSFDPEKDMALITFKTEEIAMEVVDRVDHVIKKRKINVQHHIPETKKCKKNQTKGETAEPAEVEEEPPKCTVKVKGVDKTASRDTLEYYLENARRSGGGEIETIKSDEEEEDMLYVTFKSPEVIDKVLKRQHTLGNQSVDVKRYQECLGRPEGELSERKLRTPEDIIVQDVDSSFIKFMKTSNTNQTGIKKQLELCHAEVHWPADEKGDVILKCTITLATKECFRLVKTWNKEALKNFQDYLKLLAVHKVPVLQDIWHRVIDELKTVSVPNPDTVALYVEKKSGFITIVGNKHVADNYRKKVEDIAKKVLEEAEKEKQRVKESVTSLKPIETRMLLAAKFPYKIISAFPELRVKINQNKNEILFEGMVGDIKTAMVQMYELKQSFASTTVDLGTPNKAGLYYLKQTKNYIVKKLKSRGVTAVWEVTGSKLKVMSSGDEELENSLDIIQNSVAENTIALKPASISLMNSEQWMTRVQELHAGHVGMCNIIVPENWSKIHVVTTDDIANEITDNVKRFLRLNTVTEEKIQCSRHVHRLFERFHRDELGKIAKDLHSNHVQITSLESYDGFLIGGTEDGIEQAKKSLTTLLDKVKKEEYHAEKPGLGKYMQTQKCKDGLSTLETSLGCVVRLNDEEDEMYAQNVAEFSGTDSGVKENLDRKGVNKVGYCKAYDVRNIYTVRGDMTELQVDAFVNPADDKLSLSGGLGRAFSNKEDIGKKELTNTENTVSLGSTEDFDFCCDPCLTVDHRAEAQSFCISCQENLCKKCFDTHKKLRVSRNHKVEDTPRKFAKSFVPQHARAVSTESCTFHQGEFITFFCQQHNTLGCNDCMTLYHRACDIDYIPTVCKGITETKHYKDLLSEVENAVQKRQTFEFKEMSSLTETERSIETAVADIEDFQGKINVKINSVKENLLQQLKLHKSNDTQQAVEILSTNKTVLSELKTLQEALEKFETRMQTLT